VSHVTELTLPHKVGDTLRMTVRLRQLVDGAWQPIDLTGAVVEFSLGSAPGRNTLQYLSSDEDARITIVPEVVAGGEDEEPTVWHDIEIHVEAAETRKWERMRIYELTVEYSDGTRVSYLDGDFDPHPEVAA
jgi:hypothetical protein